MDFPSVTSMQRIANSLAYSETAFVRPTTSSNSSTRPSGPLQCDLRWFTPTSEVDLCGHATLATAQALRHVNLLEEGDIVEFNTRSGVLTVASGPNESLSMDFPQTPVDELWSESEKQKVIDALCLDR